MLKNLLDNDYSKYAFALATIGGLIADQFSSGYIVALVIMILFFIYAYRDETRRQKVYQAQNLPMPIVFNISNPTNSSKALDSLFEKFSHDYPNHEENLKKYFNILRSDLIFKYDGDIFDEERFIDFLKITKHDLKKLDAQTPQNIHFHIVYIGPIANAIMIGTMLGTEGVTLYQYSKSTDSYTISVALNSRAYKEHVKEFKIIEKKTIGEIDKSVTIAIDLASHKIALQKLQEPIIHLQSTIGATIHNSEDFLRANQEIYAVINEIQQQVSHITLVYSMPTTVAIMIGMSVQNYWDIELTQFADGEYKTVIKHLDKIKYYF